MVSFLFWNLQNKPLTETISRIALNYEVDILMFAESSLEPSKLLIKLNRNGRTYNYVPNLGCKKIDLFTTFSIDFIKPIYEAERITIRHLRLPGLLDILLAITHLPSKLHWKDSSLEFECVELIDSVKLAERYMGHSRTILVGDFNMNPFESGVVSARGLHAVMSRKIAEKKSRIVQKRQYQFFYNPMWSLMGDASPGPPGTYFYNNSEHAVFFWNMFDQVLIRPELLSCFKNENLSIVESDGHNSLLTTYGIPNEQVGSDHLPIFFKLMI